MIFFILLFFLWSGEDLLNFTIKLGLILMAGWGFYLIVNNPGAF
jgi:hypothetical protein